MPYIIKRTIDPQKPQYFTLLDGKTVTLAQDECLAQRFNKKGDANDMAKLVFGERAFMLYWKVIKIKAPEGADNHFLIP